MHRHSKRYGVIGITRYDSSETLKTDSKYEAMDRFEEFIKNPKKYKKGKLYDNLCDFILGDFKSNPDGKGGYKVIVNKENTLESGDI